VRNLIGLLAGSLLFGSGLVGAESTEKTFPFAKADIGKLPKGWKADRTGKGDGSVWKVVADETAPSKSGVALAQTAEGPGPLFNLCVAEETSFRDLAAEVSFKSVAGSTDQGGGLMWRYRDANNYYIARYNPLESNFRVYKVVDGKRVQLGSKADLDVADGKWHKLSIRMVGQRIECSLNGEKHLEVEDGTFTEAGKIGLWTKADAHTHFDELRVKAVGK